MNRTIEQILGMKPMNQFDLVASPMRTLFIDNPPPANFKSWTHVPAAIALGSRIGGYKTRADRRAEAEAALIGLPREEA